MRIVYMGTPDFAVPALEALAAAGHEIPLVVTKADARAGRGKRLQPCAVKEKAIELGLNVISPEKLRGNAEVIDSIRQADPQLIVVAAYGKILPRSVLEIPPLGCVNIHGSLLPRYRGAAPIHRAVMNGDAETGVTLMYMAEEMDAGDMIAKASTPVGEKTSSELFDELSHMGAELLLKTLPSIEDGTAPRIPQDPSQVSYAPMVFKEDGVIDFSKSAESICALVRGMNSWPGSSTVYGGQIMKVRAAVPGNDEPAEGTPFGSVVKADKKGLHVACAGGSVILTRIQMPGKKEMDVSAWLLGNKIEIGTVLG